MKTFSPDQIVFLKAFVAYYAKKFNSKIRLIPDQYRGSSQFDGILCPAFVGIENLYLFLMEFGRAFASNNMGDAGEITEYMYSYRKGHRNTFVFLSNFKPF